eukprot:9048179-Alexandrium_andersonii.AAC.1
MPPPLAPSVAMVTDGLPALFPPGWRRDERTGRWGRGSLHLPRPEGSTSAAADDLQERGGRVGSLYCGGAPDVEEE